MLLIFYLPSIPHIYVLRVQLQVDVRFSDNQARYKGFVLGADVSSGIAFVKIEPREPLKAAKLGKMDSVRTEDRVVAAGCERPFEGQSLLQTFAQSHYDLGVLRYGCVFVG